ncbi:hypothetical protein MBANPS3_007841 [Mucor bainieri]
MTSPLDKLTIEILSMVFKALSDVKQVAQCRLVCKAWDPIAERAMFGNTLRVKDMNKLVKITKHLAKKPSLGSCIEDIKFGDTYRNEFNGNYNKQDIKKIKAFLQLVFTPSIKTIQAGCLNKELIESLIDIMSKSRKKFDKLETLCLLRHQHSADIHDKLAYRFRASLKELTITLSEESPSTQLLLNHLEEFGKLTNLSLHINKKIKNLEEIEAILRKCPHLKSLKLQVSPDSISSIPNKTQLKTWLVKDVEKNTSVRAIQLLPGMCPEIVLYLRYKYPNIDRAIVHNPGKDTVKRLVAAIKDVDDVEAKEWLLRSSEEVVAVAEAMKSSRNTASISNWVDFGDRILANATVTKRKSDGTTTFDFSILQLARSASDTLKAMCDMHSLDIHLMPLEDMDDEKKDDPTVSPFYLALNSSPSLEKLAFTDKWIKYQPFALKKNTQWKHLKDVTIKGTILSEGVLPLLSRVAPHLKNLTLHSCTFDAKSTQDHQIIVPQSHLDTLCIETGCFADYYEDMYDRDKAPAIAWIKSQLQANRENEFLFLHVSASSHQQDKYFVLQPGPFNDIGDYSNPCKQVIEEEYYAYVGKWPSIYVKCQSLKCIKLNLDGGLKKTLDLMAERAVENLGEWNPYKKPTVFARMFDEIEAQEKRWDRERRKQRYMDNHGLSNSEDYDSQNNSESSSDYSPYKRIPSKSSFQQQQQPV